VVRLRTSIVLLIAVVSAFAAGCGGDGGRLSKAEYEQELQAIGTELRTASAALGDLGQTTDLDKLADQVAVFRDRLDDAANKLDDLNPPEEVEEETQTIADALHAFADTFGEMEDAARDGDLAALQSAQAEIAQESAEAERAAASLQQKGYDIGDIGTD
jgi:predicted  nucleic acid-binding Zn-ribbon protein